jgi:hypothetical protein
MSEHQDEDHENRRLPEGWHLDKKVPLSLIFAMIAQVVVVVWAVAGIKSDVDLLKADNLVLHQRDSQQAADIKDTLTQLREQYKDISDRLNRLIEKGSK